MTTTGIRTGRDVADFLERNFFICDTYEREQRLAIRQVVAWHQQVERSRHREYGRPAANDFRRFAKRIEILKAQGRLTAERYFTEYARWDGAGLLPGFLDDPVRCDGNRGA